MWSAQYSCVTIPWESHRFVSGFLVFIYVENSFEDCECSCHPSAGYTDQNVEKTSRSVNEDTFLEVADRLGISWGKCQQILREDWNRHHISTEFVLWVLTIEQKQWWFFGCSRHECGLSCPCSPDLVPCDFFLFLRMKLLLWRHHSRIILIFRNICWLPYMWFKKFSSIYASSSGRNIGPIA